MDTIDEGRTRPTPETDTTDAMVARLRETEALLTRLLTGGPPVDEPAPPR